MYYDMSISNIKGFSFDTDDETSSCLRNAARGIHDEELSPFFTTNIPHDEEPKFSSFCTCRNNKKNKQNKDNEKIFFKRSCEEKCVDIEKITCDFNRNDTSKNSPRKLFTSRSLDVTTNSDSKQLEKDDENNAQKRAFSLESFQKYTVIKETT
ncbi:hypothetical protein KUTeg_016239 [Tegillarca granosa]|uniref:Uncharacterized protein n=1 Tax=Tegillarca granosa TaxID=220873 RepID=A0ABQ9EK98_TEGGR|nr:hypothetical protein KUTeg_016239 [Tegillarca granosa]